MNDKIALAMISLGTGKEVERLRQALTSASPHVDAIYITFTTPLDQIPEAVAVAEEFKANISYTDAKWEVTEDAVKWLTEFFGYDPHMKVGDKIFRFDWARNFNLKEIPKDYGWIFWMDTDDVLRKGKNLRRLAKEGIEKGFEAYYFNYLYHVDHKKGKTKCEMCGAENQLLPLWERPIKNVVIEHIRERLVRNNDHFKWIAPIHETFIEQTGTNKTDNYDVDVLHTAGLEDRKSSLDRNLNNLELAIYESKGKDPRHLYYLAKAYYDIATPEANKHAISLIQSYLIGEHKSGWPQERAQASIYLAEIYRRLGQMNNAVKSAMNALIEQPEDPAIFLNIATTYAIKREWERALFWVRIATKIPESKTTLVKNPRDIQGITLEIVYNACLNMGKIDEAWAAAEKMRLLAPDDPQVQKIYQFASQLREQRDVTRTIVQLTDYLKQTGEYHKIKPLLAAVPRITEETPFIQDLRVKNNPPKRWGEKEIVIYCGPGFTVWNPKLMDDPQGTFTGGSEEAVIMMAKELVKLDWKVTIYNDPGTDGDYDGVQYLSYWKFNVLDHFNILIAWRQPKFFEVDLKYKKSYVWLHDIQNPLDYTDKAIEKTTKFMFLSNWHRENVPKLPDDKIFLTSNGI